jgi:TolB-like protein/DNA-binding winged helix-turn-helix (wHTH) protein/Tfp pilus assembly protein PilF
MPSLISHLYAFGDFSLDAQQRALRRDGVMIALTPKAFEVLLLLVQRSGQLVTKDELMRAVWPDSFVEEANLTQTVFMLRKALGETPDRRYVLTVQGKGYRLAAEVQEVSRNGDSRADSPPWLSEGSPAISDEPEQRAFAAAARPRRHSGRGLALLPSGALTVFLLAGLAGYFHWAGSRTQAKQGDVRLMLAVLPFQNLTGDPAQEYFSEGVTEELITQAGNLDPHKLGVIARTSIMRYKNSQIPLNRVGRDLGVQYVLEGSVRRDSVRLRITAQLIRTRDETQLWAREYDREPGDLLAVQSEIANEIADQIQLTLGGVRSTKKAAAAPPSSPRSYESYDLYLKGQYFLNQRTLPDLRKAVASFQQATEKDPTNARAYAGLAMGYTLLGPYSGLPQAGFMAQGRAAALRALQLDEHLPEAHAALALIVENHDWDWQTAEKEFRRAIQLNPNYATAHQWYAEDLMWRGRFEEALAESERARQLDPLSLIIASDNGAILYYSRHYDQAIDKWRSVLEMDPNFPRAHLIVAAYIEKQMYSDALRDVETQRAVFGDAWYWAWLANVYGRSGQKLAAERALNQLVRMGRRERVDPMIYALAYAGTEQKDQTLSWLAKACTGHSNEIVSLKVSPLYDSLRGDPRFRDLLHRIGLN